MLKCKICGWEFNGVVEKHYISRDSGRSGIAALVNSPEETWYDTFDCHCADANALHKSANGRFPTLPLIGAKPQMIRDET